MTIVPLSSTPRPDWAVRAETAPRVFHRITGDEAAAIAAAEHEHVATTGFVYSYDIKPEWIARLREFSPKSNEVGWLYLTFEPGDPWIPGQRLVLYQMVHPDIYATMHGAELLAELEGPHPRSEGHMCADKVPAQFQCLCRRKLNAWRGGPCELITKSQYEIYRTTGFVPLPFWIIQGTTGGHLWQFDENHKRLCHAAGLPTAPPVMGAQPFAEFDERVVARVMKHNRLVQLNMQIDEYRRTMGAGYEQYKTGVAKQQRANWVEHLSTQVNDLSELADKATKQDTLDNLPRTDIDYERLAEQNDAYYIETGRVLHPSEMKY